MIPVFDANRSKTDAVLTTASLTGTPPHIAPSSEMKRSDGTLPAYIIVVEFSTPRSQTVKR